MKTCWFRMAKKKFNVLVENIAGHEALGGCPSMQSLKK